MNLVCVTVVIAIRENLSSSVIGVESHLALNKEMKYSNSSLIYYDVIQCLYTYNKTSVP